MCAETFPLNWQERNFTRRQTHVRVFARGLTRHALRARALGVGALMKADTDGAV